MRKYSADIRKMKPRTDMYWVYKRFGIDFGDNFIQEIQQIQASEETIAAMREVIRRGVRRSHHYLTKRKQDSIVSFHMLNWAPQMNNEIPFGEIWVYDIDENY